MNDDKVDISAQVNRIQAVVAESRRKLLLKTTCDISIEQEIGDAENKAENVF